MQKILLNDLLKIEDLSKYKIKFNIHNGYEDPMLVYIQNPEIVNNQWLFWRTEQRYFNVGESVICLLRIGYDKWLLTTIKEVETEFGIKNGINYHGKELIKHNMYYGRIIVKFHKTFQRAVVWSDKIMDQLEVLQILPSVYDGVDFPGYDKVSLSFKQLETIVNRHKKDWVKALENQKAVYLIRDSHNGKLYVGSATGDNGMLLQRWSNYITNGHGGNIELVDVVHTLGMDYIKEHFHYSILENYNSRVDKSYILNRESWWKSILGTRSFGYNLN